MTVSGPLVGVKVVEFAAQGPGPFVGTLLSDLGAEVVRIERVGAPALGPEQVDARGRRRVALNLKSPEHVEICLRLLEKSELVFEGFRPGVMERLGLGPDVVLIRNPRIVYGRMTGWGQESPYKFAAGHDINYLALSGVLHAVGTADQIVPPLNIGADYGGGAMFLMTGLLAGLLHARATGEGQVVDAAMTDGAAYLINLFYGLSSTGEWKDERQANWVDGGAPFFNAYQCADGKWISVGAMEPDFYTLLVEKIGAASRIKTEQLDRSGWPEMRRIFREVFAGKTRDEWCALLENTDACFAPVLSMTEAPEHPHNVQRGTFVKLESVTNVTPAPQFSATPGGIQSPPQGITEVSDLLEAWNA